MSADSFDKEAYDSIMSDLDKKGINAKCPKCGKMLPFSPGKTLCPYCGQEIRLVVKW